MNKASNVHCTLQSDTERKDRRMYRSHRHRSVKKAQLDPLPNNGSFSEVPTGDEGGDLIARTIGNQASGS